ncbi:MAG: lamin tail domain-containing protein [Chloroflexi bacterium]|nr:lamin tail domain-containing protein [Chloroflexota bacterium]
MDRRKLFLYVLVNVFVSACVTGAILFWYDRNYRASLSPAVAPAAAPNGGNAAVAPAVTATPQGDIPVEIVSVVGAGTQSAEAVVIQYSGEGQLNLASWQLKDEDGNTFTFPQLTLYPNGAVQVHTANGTNTVIDLYWGLPNTVWDSGENANLYDAQGNLRAVYRIP